MKQASIILIDPDPGVRRYVAAAATRLGLRVAAAATFAEAEELCRNDSFDAFVLDTAVENADFLSAILAGCCKRGVITTASFVNGILASAAWPVVHKPYVLRQIIDLVS